MSFQIEMISHHELIPMPSIVIDFRIKLFESNSQQYILNKTYWHKPFTFNMNMTQLNRLNLKFYKKIYDFEQSMLDFISKNPQIQHRQLHSTASRFVNLVSENSHLINWNRLSPMSLFPKRFSIAETNESLPKLDDELTCAEIIRQNICFFGKI